MNKPKACGQGKPTTKTSRMRSLYEDLLKMGTAHKIIQKLTLSQAVIQRYVTPEAADAAFGSGFYAGIQKETGPYASYRKLWDRTRNEKARQDPRKVASIESLRAQVKVCLAVGVSELDILREVQRSLNFRALFAA